MTNETKREDSPRAGRGLSAAPSGHQEKQAMHTPGPWAVGWRALEVTAADGQMKICDVRGWGYLTGKGSLSLDYDRAVAIQTANASLIAAAPDMLEALEKALPWLTICDDRRSDAALRMCEAAIAKARTHD